MKNQIDEVSEAIIEFAKEHKEELDAPDWLIKLNAFLEEKGLPPKKVPKNYWSEEKKSENEA